MEVFVTYEPRIKALEQGWMKAMFDLIITEMDF